MITIAFWQLGLIILLSVVTGGSLALWIVERALRKWGILK